MNENKKKESVFKITQSLIFTNIRKIIVVFGILILIFISFQTYNYYSLQELKKNSINFFNTIEKNEEILASLQEIKKSDNIFSTLSSLKIIQNHNKQKNFNISNELYKEIVFSNKLNNLYSSSISAHASYTLINASYIENTNKYLEDISIFINFINDDLESYFSIKKELEFLLAVTRIDLNKSEYKNNKEVIDLFNFIYNSNQVSSSVKERVKKIHEFQLYK